MPSQHFLSYSSADGREFALRLHQALAAGPNATPVWLDVHELKPGKDWDDQIVDAIRSCRSLLFLMTPDSVASQSVCKKEWSRALAYKKPVIPLLAGAGVEAPFRLQDRQYIDFTGDFDLAVDQLRKHLVWQESAQGVLQALRDRLEDARHDLRRAPEGPQRKRIEDDVAWLESQVKEKELLLADPEAVARRVDQNILQGLEQERDRSQREHGQGEERQAPARRVPVINAPPAIAPAHFQGRQAETQRLLGFLRDEGQRLLTIVGRGGAGKTVLACRALHALETGTLPTGESLPCDGIVYQGGNSSQRLLVSNLYADLCKLLPAERARDLDDLARNSEASVELRMSSLLAAFPHGRVVVLLDNFEDMLDPQTHRISDPDLAAALRAFLQAPRHGVKLILTTRQAPQDIALVQPARQGRLDLDEGLPSPHAENVLRAMDVDGKVGLRDAPEALLTEVCRRTRGYPRALEALFAILSADRSLSLEEIAANSERLLPENVVEVLVGEAFDRLDDPAQQVMQALAVYGRAVTPTAVDDLLQPYTSGIDSSPILNRLVRMQFAIKEGPRYSLHSSDREYALARVPRGQPEDRPRGATPPYTRFALLHRGADYFRQVRLPREARKTAADLAPLLGEFDLRYAARDYDAAAEVLAELRQGHAGAAKPAEIVVLVVDDAPVDRLLAGQLAQKDLGAKVVYARNGVEALEVVRKQKPDLVLTDAQMPEMDGLELTQALRMQFPSIPVILMTAHGSEELALAALQKGAASYVPKRNLPQDLAGTIQMVLSASRTQQGQQRMEDRRTRTELEFRLENDPALIDAFVTHLQEALHLDRQDETETIRIGIALREALLNAMQHGNLELGAELRGADLAAFDRLAEERRGQQPYCDRRVTVVAREAGGDVTFVIKDEGPGFDPATLPDPSDPATLEQIGGRGLLLIRTFMDEVQFNARGNEITMVKRVGQR